ncbi:MAG: hypothetical protein ACRBB0_26440 [Pelagimonas sp.]|uniref:hypothetical protein n=1 Tax=Pelagimonas sp. TaxID=2073170 RepID=UPI003D6BCE48
MSQQYGQNENTGEQMTLRPSDQTIVCILGMHRSGTSSLAGSLEERGLFLGEVVNQAKFNSKGNKENLERMKINDDLLVLNGGRWDSPPRRMVWDDALRRRRDAHIAKYCDIKAWGFKDPRTLFTLPFWQETGLDFQFVGTFRHPKAVEKSLLRRGPNLAPELPAVTLWKRYNRKLLEILQERPFPVVCFDWPTEKYLRGVDQIANDLGLRATGDTGAVFFENALRSSNNAGPLPEIRDPTALRLYEELLDQAMIVPE